MSSQSYISIKTIFAAIQTIAVGVFLSACGGGGGGTTSVAPGGDSSGGTNGSVLFVADANTKSIGSAANSNPVPGVAALDRLIMGAATGIVPAISGLAYDSVSKRLYASNGNIILVFNNADTATGNVAPSRTITTPPANSDTAIFRAVAVDTVNDLLYAPDAIKGEVRVYPASTATGFAAYSILSGIGSPASPQAIAIDMTRDFAYILNDNYDPPGGPLFENKRAVHIIENAKNGGGTNRVLILSDNSRFNAGLVIDSANNRLFVSDDTGSIDIYDNASSISGTPAPNRKIVLQDAVRTKLALDQTNNRLYALASTALYIIDNAGTATGVITAKKVTVSGATSMEAIVHRP